MRVLRIAAGGLLAVAGILGGDGDAVAQDRFAPPVDVRQFGPPPVSRRGGISIFIPPIGGFGGFSADIGGGRVNVQVGPSGYGPYGEPAFGGVNVEVFRPRSYYAPPVVYGPAHHPAYGPAIVGTPFLGNAGADESQPSEFRSEEPAPAPRDSDAGSLDSVLPPVPDSVTPELGTSTDAAGETSVETTVPQRKSDSGKSDPVKSDSTTKPARPDSGPVLPPQFPPQTSRRPAPRFFPTSGPALLPPGSIPRNGFDVDNKVRPNPPTLPGHDPFGPTPPRRNLPEA